MVTPIVNVKLVFASIKLEGCVRNAIGAWDPGQKGGADLKPVDVIGWVWACPVLPLH